MGLELSILALTFVAVRYALKVDQLGAIEALDGSLQQCEIVCRGISLRAVENMVETSSGTAAQLRTTLALGRRRGLGLADPLSGLRALVRSVHRHEQARTRIAGLLRGRLALGLVGMVLIRVAPFGKGIAVGPHSTLVATILAGVLMVLMARIAARRLPTHWLWNAGLSPSGAGWFHVYALDSLEHEAEYGPAWRDLKFQELRTGVEVLIAHGEF